MAEQRLDVILFGDAGSCNFISTHSISFQPLYTREDKKHLDVARIEPARVKIF